MEDAAKIVSTVALEGSKCNEHAARNGPATQAKLIKIERNYV